MPPTTTIAVMSVGGLAGSWTTMVVVGLAGTVTTKRGTPLEQTAGKLPVCEPTKTVPSLSQMLGAAATKPVSPAPFCTVPLVSSVPLVMKRDSALVLDTYNVPSRPRSGEPTIVPCTWMGSTNVGAVPATLVKYTVPSLEPTNTSSVAVSTFWEMIGVVSVVPMRTQG